MKKIIISLSFIFFALYAFAQNRLVRTENAGWAYIVHDEETKTQDAFSVWSNFKNTNLDGNYVEYYGFSTNFLLMPSHTYLWHTLEAASLNKIDTTTFKVVFSENPSWKDYWFLSFQSKEQEEIFESKSVGGYDNSEKEETTNKLSMMSKNKTALEQAQKDIKKMVKFNSLLNMLPEFRETADFFEASAYQETLKSIEKVRKTLGKGDLFEMLHYQIDLYQCRVMSSFVYDIENKKTKTDDDIKQYFERTQSYKKHTKYMKERYKATIDKKATLYDKYFKDNKTYAFQHPFQEYTGRYQDVPDDYQTFLSKFKGGKQAEEYKEKGNTINAEGYSGLQATLMKKDLVQAKTMVQAGTKLRYENPKNKQTVLQTALIYANSEILALILNDIRKEYSASENSGNYFDSELRNAISNGAEQISIENFDVAYKKGNGKLNLKWYYRGPKVRYNKIIEELSKIDRYFEDFSGEYERETLLMVACQKNDLDMVKLLLSKILPDYYNLQNKEKMTALMIATQVGNKEMVRIMLEKGINASVKNTNDKQAIDFAKDKEIKKMLKEKMKTK